MPCLEFLVSSLASMRQRGSSRLTLDQMHGDELGEILPSDVMSTGN
jgi:hypothetical protein